MSCDSRRPHVWVLISEEKKTKGDSEAPHVLHTRTRRYYCSRCRATVNDIDHQVDGTYRLTRREFGLNAIDDPFTPN